MKRILLALLVMLNPIMAIAGPVISLGDLNKANERLSTPFYVNNPPKIFFNRTTAELGSELWVSDGTPAGTVLVKDIVPGSEGSNPIGFSAATIGGQPAAYFMAETPGEGMELWVTDGTGAGTVMLKDINPGLNDGMSTDSFPEPPIVTAFGTSLALFAADNGVHGRELWMTDGTPLGTIMLQDINPGVASSDPEHFFIFGIVAFFSATTAIAGEEPWGTFAVPGTAVQLADINPGAGSSEPYGFAASDTHLVFNADDNVNGAELWQYDFMTTSLVSDLTPGSDGSLLANFFRFSPTQVIFTFGQLAAGVPTFKLMSTDGTGAGTSVLLDTPCAPGGIFVGLTSSALVRIFNGRAVMPCASLTDASFEPWVTDGTPAGTKQLADINPGAASSEFIGALLGNNTLVMPADDGKHGIEPWVSDGTTEGTRLLKDFNPGEASSTDQFSVFLQVLSTPPPGATLSLLQMRIGDRVPVYVTDGTLENSRELFDDSGTGTEDSFPNEFESVGKTVLFQATHSTKGSELFISNGKQKGTKILKNINRGGSSVPRDFTKFKKGTYLFNAADSKRGRELWITDGTKKGTKLVKDINPGGASGIESLPIEIVKGKAVFPGNDGVTGTELWISNGTKKGTKLLKDIFPGAEESSILEMARVGSRVVFSADDGVSGPELWVTDGTPAGSVLLADIEPGAPGSSPSDFEEIGNRAFFRAFDSTFGTELWVTDGTPAGTLRVKDIQPGVGGSFPSGLTAADSVVFFAASDGGLGTEIWRSDGTDAGTVMVADIAPGAAGSNPFYFAPLSGDRVAFSADDGVNGRELWLASSTPGSGSLLKDIFPGIGSGFPSLLMRAGTKDLIVFAATTAAEGSELWITNGTPEGTVLAADIVPGTESSLPADFFIKGKKLYFSAETTEFGREPYITKIP